MHFAGPGGDNADTSPLSVRSCLAGTQRTLAAGSELDHSTAVHGMNLQFIASPPGPRGSCLAVTLSGLDDDLQRWVGVGGESFEGVLELVQ
jgi:hypothetical protein